MSWKYGSCCRVLALQAWSPEFKLQSHQKKKKKKKKEVLAVWSIIPIPSMFFRNWVMTWIASCPPMNTCDVTESPIKDKPAGVLGIDCAHDWVTGSVSMAALPKAVALGASSRRLSPWQESSVELECCRHQWFWWKSGGHLSSLILSILVVGVMATPFEWIVKNFHNQVYWGIIYAEKLTILSG
jgi:hypothetical protein